MEGILVMVLASKYAYSRYRKVNFCDISSNPADKCSCVRCSLGWIEKQSSSPGPWSSVLDSLFHHCVLAKSSSRNSIQVSLLRGYAKQAKAPRTFWDTKWMELGKPILSRSWYDQGTWRAAIKDSVEKSKTPSDIFALIFYWLCLSSGLLGP